MSVQNDKFMGMSTGQVLEITAAEQRTSRAT